MIYIDLILLQMFIQSFCTKLGRQINCVQCEKGKSGKLCHNATKTYL